MSAPRHHVQMRGQSWFHRLVMRVAALLVLCSLSSLGAADDVADCVKRVERLLDMQFVRIPPGMLEKIPYPDPQDIGLDRDEHSRVGETYDLRILDAFYIATKEVTCDQWERVMKTQPWKEAETPPTEGNHPAVMRFCDALAFCREVSKTVGGNGVQVRLPLEIEWEYACRAGTRSRYSFGDDPKMLDDFAWHQGNLDGKTFHAVGTKQPNAWGLHDMHGSVFEWCVDFSYPDYPLPESYKALSKEDHTTPGHHGHRVIRGGGPSGTPYRYRSDFRYSCGERSRASRIGLRLVISSKADGHHQGFFVPDKEPDGEPGVGAASR